MSGIASRTSSETTNPPVSCANRTTEDVSPFPLSFPAILRHPGLSDRYAHLRTTKERSQDAEGAAKVNFKKGRRHDNEGKRWVRRKENAKFIGNPHITPASKRDFTIQSSAIPHTFPEPLPPYLSRNTHVPSPRLPTKTDPITANAGRFSLSLKGTRRELRKMGGKAQGLVKDVEAEVLVWLEGGVILSPSADGDGDGDGGLRFPGVAVREREDLREVGRTPLQLVWTTDDALVRYVVHCCARYHDIVSFSKEVQSRRLTYLLRPNVTRPDFRARSTVDTPPVTDLDYTSHEYESDLISESPSDTDVESDAGAATAAEAAGLTAIQESPAFEPVALQPIVPEYDDVWSGDTDAEGDESGNEHDLAQSVDSLSLRDPNSTPRAVATARHHSSLRPRAWDHRRSASSPSRSPSRRPLRRAHLRIDPPKTAHPKSFYEYLYA